MNEYYRKVDAYPIQEESFKKTILLKIRLQKTGLLKFMLKTAQFENKILCESDENDDFRDK